MDALEKATAYLSRRPHTEKEVTGYLLEKGYTEQETADAVRSLKDYNYIDDLAYAKMYFSYSFEKGRGSDRVRRELAGKGVPRDLIDQAYGSLENVPDESELARGIAEQIAAEAGVGAGDLSYQEKQKLQARIARRLATRGFSPGICYSAAREAVK